MELKTVGDIRKFLDKLPDDAGVVVEFYDNVSSIGVICHCVDVFAIGTSTNDPGLVLTARPVQR